MEARFHQPPEHLERFFTTFCFGTVTVPDGEVVQDAIQPEWGTLRFFPDDLPRVQIGDKDEPVTSRFIASGPTSRTKAYQMPGSRFWGIGLLPLGWETFVGIPAHLMADRLVDGASDVQFAKFAPLAETLLDVDGSEEGQLKAIIDFFSETCPRAKREDPRVIRIHQCLLGGDFADVKAMANNCGIGGRTLERLCRRAFGFSPKLLLRRQRFMRSLAHFMLDPANSWSDSIDTTYYDQSHFVRDSHRFLGMTPGEYASLEHPILAGFMRDRAQIRGSAVQTLDKPGG
ncbi:MAG: helix-turn-helix domain-containing protein [Pontixanthobacter sp.]